MAARPVLIDCDPGIDDALALLLACASPELELLGVTTVSGNVEVEQTARNALDVLALAGRTDVPVAAGASRPLVRAQPRRSHQVHGAAGLGGVVLPRSPVRADPRPAVDFLAELIGSAPAPVTVVALGPLTNVALLYAVHPGPASSLDQVIVLGGSVGSGNVTPAAEFNSWTDPEAAYRVLTAPGLARPVRTVQIGLDVTAQTGLDRAAVDQLRTAGAVGAVAAELLDHYLDRPATPRRPVVVVHDAVAVAAVVRPGLVQTAPAAVTVDCSPGPGRGRTLVSADPGSTPVEVATRIDAAAVTELILARVGGPGRPDPEAVRGEQRASRAGPRLGTGN